jgi:DNA-binding CsgD family transcriptional regulator/PAS domain-containing protein
MVGALIMPSHHDETNDGDLLDLLYSAAADPALWTEFLTLLARRMDATAVGLIGHDPSDQQYTFNAHVGFPVEGLRLYGEYYGAMDPWYARGKDHLIAGVVELGSVLCPPAVLENTEYYSDYLRHYPCFHQCGVIIEKQEQSRAVLTLMRAKEQEDFNDSHLRFLTSLYPHLRRALQVQRRMVDLKLMASGAAGVVDALDVGLIGLDTRGKICLLNRRAEALLDSGEFLVIRNGKITATDPTGAVALGRLLRPLGGQRSKESLGDEIELRGAGRSVYLSAFPFTVDNRLNPQSGVMITITDPATMPGSRSRLLSALFGLTPAEIRVAMMLVGGLDAREIADRGGVSYDTVRFQLKSIYNKLGVSRQAQLVRMISKLPGRS